MRQASIAITWDRVELKGDLSVPEHASGLVLFAHGSGSSRHSPRNRHVARHLAESGLATLLLDLLTEDEGAVDQFTGAFRFDVELLARRLVGAVCWAGQHPLTRELGIGLFGASTGAAAALIAAAERADAVHAVVSRGGRPDLADAVLSTVRVPTLLLVGELDEHVLALNERAFDRLATTEKRLEVVAGASHLFEEPGAMDRVVELSRRWFRFHLNGRRQTFTATG